MCVEATNTDSPNGSEESSDGLYDEYTLVYFMFNNNKQILNSFNGNIIVSKMILWL